MRQITFKNTKLRLHTIKILAIALLIPLCSASLSFAQNFATAPANNMFEATMRAADSTTLIAGNQNVHLWGLEEVTAAPPLFKLKARTALTNTIGNGKVQCEIKTRKSASDLWAQCINNQDLDLGLFMIQNGYAIVDRAIVYNSVFEDAYIQAEMKAQEQALGIWGLSVEGSNKSDTFDKGMMVGLILFICVLAAFGVLSLLIMRGFKRVVDAQNDTIQALIKERRLRMQERRIVASMLEAEMKTNKSKIEAYIVVYEEMLRALRNTQKTPSYQKAGDIVQVQPALSRTIFDRNADKLDILGQDLAGNLIHFYARVKSAPDYQNLEPESPLDEAIRIVQNAIRNSQKLNKRADELLASFETTNSSGDPA